MENGFQDFFYHLMETRDPARVISLTEEVIGWEVEVGNFSERLDTAMAYVDWSRTGFRLHFYVMCRSRPEWGEDIEGDLGWRLATELGDYVLVDNLHEQFRFTLFAPDGSRAEVKIFDTEDSCDVVEPDRTAYWAIYWAIEPWILAETDEALMEEHFLLFDFSEESVRAAVRRDLVPHFLSLPEETRDDILTQLPALGLEDAYIVSQWNFYCTPFYIDDDPQGFLKWMIAEFTIATAAQAAEKCSGET